MYDEIIWLIGERKTTDEYGDQIIEPSERMVFAELRSIGQSEFYQAQALGIKPELKFILADYLDYNGEKTLRYQAFDAEKPEEYTIIRTYRDGNDIELTCKKGLE